MQSVKIAFRNITRQKKRTVLLGGAIAFGVLIIILIGSFTTGVLENVRENFTGIFGGHIYVSGEELSSTERILSRIGDREILDSAISAIEDKISDVHVRSSGSGDAIFGSRQEPLNLQGVEWETESELWDDLGVVRGKKSMLSGENAIILPESAALSLGVEIGETILFKLSTITGQINVGELSVAGVYPGNQSFNITGAYTGLSYLNSLIGLKQDEFQILNITLLDLEQIDSAAETLYREIKLLGEVEPLESDSEGSEGNGPPRRMMNMMGGFVSTLADDEEAWEGTKFYLSTLNDMMDPLLSLVRILDAIRISLFAVLLLITMVGLLNTFRMVLIERTQEIGTMRAIGMQRSSVRNIFLFEALFLALAGAAAGLIIALILMGVLGNVQVGQENMLQLFTKNGEFAFPIVVIDVITTILILAGVTIFSAWLPARKAARLKPADALRATY